MTALAAAPSWRRARDAGKPLARFGMFATFLRLSHLLLHRRSGVLEAQVLRARLLGADHRLHARHRLHQVRAHLHLRVRSRYLLLLSDPLPLHRPLAHALLRHGRGPARKGSPTRGDGPLVRGRVLAFRPASERRTHANGRQETRGCRFRLDESCTPRITSAPYSGLLLKVTTGLPP
eukprot:1188657-Prorocentrum_minimum.AAC.5